MVAKWGYIYSATTTSFIRRGWHKIGYTSDIGNRKKKLSQGTNMPEDFMIDCWFKFKTIDDAKLVEKRVHDLLDSERLRVKSGREFFEKDEIFLDVVNDAANQLNIPTLSNYDLQMDNLEEMGIFIPCRFFYLHDESVLENFLHIVGLSYSSFLQLPTVSQDTRGLVYNGLPEGIVLPNGFEGGIQHHLKSHDKEPYILSRIINNPHNPLKSWAEDQLQEVQESLDNYFDFDENWRQRIKR